jgi:hypothetical protein
VAGKWDRADRPTCSRRSRAPARDVDLPLLSPLRPRAGEHESTLAAGSFDGRDRRVRSAQPVRSPRPSRCDLVPPSSCLPPELQNGRGSRATSRRGARVTPFERTGRPRVRAPVYKIRELMRRQMCAQRFSDLARLRDAATGLLPRHCRSRALPKLLAGRSRSTRDVSGQAPRGYGRGRPGLTANSALASIGARASQRGGASSPRSNVVLANTLLASWRRPLKPSEAGPIACGGCMGALPTATKNQVGRSGGRWCAA